MGRLKTGAERERRRANRKGALATARETWRTKGPETLVAEFHDDDKIRKRTLRPHAGRRS